MIPEAWSPSTANQLNFFKEIISVLFKVVGFFLSIRDELFSSTLTYSSYGIADRNNQLNLYLVYEVNSKVLCVKWNMSLVMSALCIMFMQIYWYLHPNTDLPTDK